MFSFAQFAPILPYIILAITSFAGITGYTLNYNQHKLSNNDTPDKEIKIESVNDIELDNTHAYFNCEQISFFQCQSETNNKPYVCQICHSLPLCSSKLYATSYYSQLNQRPPPSNSIA